MEKRTILAKAKPKVEKPRLPTEDEIFEKNSEEPKLKILPPSEDEMFEKPIVPSEREKKEKKKRSIPVPVPEPLEKSPHEKHESHEDANLRKELTPFEKGRARSLEVRRAKAKEKKELLQQAKILTERKLYEELRGKYGSHPPIHTPVQNHTPQVQPVQNHTPQAEKKRDDDIDYERIIRGTAGMMSNFEKRIREDEQKKRNDLTKKYEMEQEQRRRSQMDTVSLLSGRAKHGRTMQRTNDIRAQLANKYKNNWNN